MQCSYTASMNFLPLHSDGVRSCHHFLPSFPEWLPAVLFAFFLDILWFIHIQLTRSPQSHKHIASCLYEESSPMKPHPLVFPLPLTHDALQAPVSQPGHWVTIQRAPDFHSVLTLSKHFTSVGLEFLIHRAPGIHLWLGCKCDLCKELLISSLLSSCIRFYFHHSICCFTVEHPLLLENISTFLSLFPCFLASLPFPLWFWNANQASINIQQAPLSCTITFNFLCITFLAPASHHPTAPQPKQIFFPSHCKIHSNRCSTWHRARAVIHLGTGKRVQWLRYLPHKHEDPSSDTSKPSKFQKAMVVCWEM